MIAIDYETFPISEEHPYPKPVCLSYYRDEGFKGILAADEIEKWLQQYLNEDILIAHNASFEVGVTYTWYPNLREKLKGALRWGKIRCTMIQEQLLKLQKKKAKVKDDLATLVEQYFQVDISTTKIGDSWRLRYGELEGMPVSEWPKEAYEYSLMDSVWAHKIYTAQNRVDCQPSIEAECYLNLMGATGFEIDTDRVNQLETEIYKYLEPMYKLLIEKGFFTVKKGQQRPKVESKIIKAYVEENIEAVMYTPKGNVSCKGEHLELYVLNTEDEYLNAYLKVLEYDKVLTAFISRLKNSKLIRSSYSACKSTGRTSSKSSKLYPSVNIQQMPRQVKGMTWDIRNCFVARKGHKLVSIDYSGLELASTGHQLGKFYTHSALHKTINQGNVPTDLHSVLAAQIATIKWGRKVTYEEFFKNKKEKEYAEIRQLAKPINLGFPGGIGYDVMRGQLAKEGVATKFQVLEKGRDEKALQRAVFKLKSDYPNLRVARLSTNEFAIVEDELVGLKRVLFDTYPELEYFLKNDHYKFIDGDNFTWVKNDYGEWEKEPAYTYNIYGIHRNWCTYASFCNGYLMQTPSAVGAKRMVTRLCREYMGSREATMLAFIHDEIIFEVVDSVEKYDIIKNIGYKMIEYMQTVLSSVRIAVEASEMSYWSKSGGDWETILWKDPPNLKGK